MSEQGTERKDDQASVPARREVFTLQPRTLDEAMEFSKLIAASELCPPGFRGKPQDVLIAVQMGNEIGIPPMQALQNIAVINGRPSMWGDLVIGLVQASGLLEWIEERDAQEAMTEQEGKCEVKRRNQPNTTARTYSMEMADKAGLTRRGGPQAPWATHPGRMLQMRARSWALRDAFADVLKGLQFREEVGDYQMREPRLVSMPRRASEAAAEKVEKFIGKQEAKAKEPKAARGGEAAAQKPKPKAEAPNTWVGVVAAVDEKSGKGWKLYSIRGQDGQAFSTFDAKFAAFAREAGSSEVEIGWQEVQSKDGKKTYRQIVSIELHLGREPGEDDDIAF